MRIAPQAAEELHALHYKLQDIQILIQKGLYAAGLELAESSKTKAAQIDKLPLLLELLYLQKKILVETNFNLSELQEKFDEISNQELVARSLLDRYLFLHDVYLRLAFCNRYNLIPDGDLIQKIAALQLEPMDAWSPNSLILYYQIQVDLLRTRTRVALNPKMEKLPFAQFLEEAFVIQKHILVTFKKDDVFLKEHEEIYLANLDRYLTIALHLNQFQEFAAYERDFKKFRKRLQYYRNIVHLNLLRYIKERRFMEGCWFVEEDQNLLDRQLTEYRSKIPESRLGIIYFACLQLYFISEKFGPAQKWLRKVKHLEGAEIQPVLLNMTHLLDLIVQFELKLLQRSESPEDFVDAVAQFLRRQNVEHPFVLLFLKTFRALALDLASPARLILEPQLAACKALLAGKTKEDPYALLLWWMESRVSGKKMTELADQYL